MKLDILIHRLNEIKKIAGEDAEVSLMTEETVPNGENIQFNALVTDLAFSNRSGVIVIGKELDQISARI